MACPSTCLNSTPNNITFILPNKAKLSYFIAFSSNNLSQQH